MCGAQGPRHHAGGDGAHAGALEMEIKGTRRKRLYHVTLYMHVMFILFMHLILRVDDGSIIR